MWYGQPGWGYGMMGGFGGFGGIIMVLLFIVVVSVAFGLLRDVFGSHGGRRGGQGGQMPRRAALDILDERYARGEIDADEYKRRRADLGG